MDNELRDKLDELYHLIDNLDCVKNLKKIKKNIPSDLIELINNYRNVPTVLNKKKLYEHKLFQKYIQNETELNYLIMAINNEFRKKRNCCESN